MMKKRLLTLCFAVSGFFAAAQPTPSEGTVAFTPGNLVIYRFNDESGTKGGIVPAFIDEITPAGELVRSIPMPTEASGDNRRFMGGLFNQLREGLISLSADGRYLTVLGLDGPRNGTAYASYPKVIGRISGNGEVNTSTAIPTSDIGNVGRNVVTNDGSGFYTTGGTGMVRYVPLGFNAGVAADNLASAPVVGGTTSGFSLFVFNDRLYFAEHTSGSSANLTGTIGTLGTGLPTPSVDMDPAAEYTALPLNGLTLPNQFVILDHNADGIPDLLYVVEVMGAGVNSVVRKYSYEEFDGVYQWFEQGSFSHAKIRDGKGITARVEGNDVRVYVSTAPATGKPSVVRINDTIFGFMDGAMYNVTQDYEDINTPGLVTTILYASLEYTYGGATDGSTVNFRGIALAPSPFNATSSAEDLDKIENFSAYLTRDNNLQLSVFSKAANPDAQVYVTDMSGRMLVNRQVRLASGNSRVEVPMNSYASGIYIVTLVNGNQVQRLKFAK